MIDFKALEDEIVRDIEKVKNAHPPRTVADMMAIAFLEGKLSMLRKLRDERKEEKAGATSEEGQG